MHTYESTFLNTTQNLRSTYGHSFIKCIKSSSKYASNLGDPVWEQLRGECRLEIGDLVAQGAPEAPLARVALLEVDEQGG
jgi:hypothetical protein